MTRKEFIKMSGLLGIGLPFVSSCNWLNNNNALKSTDKVLIIGAGAAGLTSAYALNQLGVDVQVLEAATNYGGRMKRNAEFADFPIPVGAEWLHTKRKVLDRIVNDPSVSVDIDTQPYDFKVDYALQKGEKVSLKDLGFTIDQKFIGSTWFDFFEEYVVPSIRSRLKFNQIVNSIDYASDRITVSTEGENSLRIKSS